jgi:hypothetical protein
MSPEEYRRHAAECLRMTESVPNPEQHIRLIHMAQCWLQLAQQAEKKLSTTEPLEA